MSFHRLKVGAILLAAVLALPLTSARGEELRPQLDDLVAHFIEVVFGQEYQGVGAAQSVIARWDTSKPVGITIQGRATQHLADMASRRLGAISQLTGVKFKQVKPGGPGPSIDLLFLRRAEMGKINIPNTDPAVVRALAGDPTMVCFFLKWQMPAERIVKAVIAVNVERDPVEIDSCLLEELTQVMGLPNDVKAYWTTLFNPYDSGLQYSPWDALYLKTLYGPHLAPGMTPAQVRERVRPVFAEVLSNNNQKP